MPLNLKKITCSFRQDHSETEETTSKANGCERDFTIDDGIELLPAIVPRELIPSAEEEPATWSPARVRPSVVLQMKTLNNLVAGCKSRREATLIDTRRRTPLRYTAREHLWMRAMNHEIIILCARVWACMHARGFLQVYREWTCARAHSWLRR